MPVLTQIRIRPGRGEHTDEGPGHPVVEAVDVLQGLLVGGEQPWLARRERVRDSGGRQAARLVAVRDALTVERVDGTRGVADDYRVRADSWTDAETHGQATAERCTAGGPRLEAPRRRNLGDEVVHELGRVHVLAPALWWTAGPLRRSRGRPRAGRSSRSRARPGHWRRGCRGRSRCTPRRCAGSGSSRAAPCPGASPGCDPSPARDRTGRTIRRRRSHSGPGPRSRLARALSRTMAPPGRAQRPAAPGPGPDPFGRAWRDSGATASAPCQTTAPAFSARA